MDELRVYRRVLKVATYSALALCFIAAALFQEYKSIPIGIALGIVVSYVNANYLALKVRRFMDGITSQDQRRRGLGFFTRAAFALAAAMIAIKKPEMFNIYAVVGGLVFSQFLLLFAGIIQSRKEEDDASEKGVKKHA
ncbi:ATP synthase subunit I [Paenibacillus sp. YPG26]|uniref:ATP synthase subunit I n=1 Tax=Paenibacillus sp. YPG26 TaxID=2878915 RepID=UPI00203CA050|nr:ATP synthase subunit I [Paenibacillus sp. YPG26]USB32888.1 ATP synthase subunit I [Paenibacillus sp. YPG26]